MDYKKENLELAEIIFPDIKETMEDLEAKYPKRNLEEGAIVTRFAPSPTGFVHTGALFTTLVNRTITKQKNGIFMLRIEDTDTKREVEGSVAEIINQINEYGLSPDEGMVSETEEKGIYGPYKQSMREKIYKICAKELLKRGIAYPCFCSTDDLNKIRAKQEETKIRPGYYGRYARCRNIDAVDAIERIKNGEDYILRFKSNGSHMKKLVYKDIIKGRIEIAENDMDIVLIKSDGLPTYHFAHAVDDHFMRTTTVIRGEEWLASVPLHMELFDSLGFERMEYGHLPTVLKLENGNKRKLSKRKDPEAAVSYFMEHGFEKVALLEYLLGIVNSDFEPWRRANLDKPMEEFEMRLDKISVSGALFDLVKLKDVSKEYISRLKSNEVYDKVLAWAKVYSEEYAKRIESDSEYAHKIFAIERDNATKVRKDFTTWAEVEEAFAYCYEDMYINSVEKGYNYEELIAKMGKEKIIEVLKAYKEVHTIEVEKQDWFNMLKEIAEKLGFCTNMKEYKKDPDAFIGNISHVAEIVRVAITNRKNTPDIYEIMKVLGNDIVYSRIDRAINNI